MIRFRANAAKGDLLASLAVVCWMINWCVIDQCGSASSQPVPTDVVSVGV